MKLFAIIFMYASLLVSVPLICIATILFSLVGIFGQFIWIPMCLISIARGETDVPSPLEMFLVFASMPYSMFAELYGTPQPKPWRY